MRRWAAMGGAGGMVLGLLAMLAVLSSAVSGAAATASGGTAARMARLADDLERAESVRAVKRLQRAYMQFAEFGLWDEMAGLFADDAELAYGADAAKGRAAIGRYFLQTFGGGQAGLPPGGVRLQMMMAPTVTLSADGLTARGRWEEFSMLGRYGGDARWTGGVLENEYVKERGVWKIARVRFHPQLAGPYETGWRNVGDDLEVIPYHFTPQQAGAPTGIAVARRGPPPGLAAMERRIEALRAEDEVRNLQNAYGYYVDRRMWDDVTDLFAPDGVLVVAGVGAYVGQKGVRRLLDQEGPVGLRRGEVHDKLQLDMVVTISADGREARGRGIELGMLGVNGAGAWWTETVFENRYAKENGVWRIREMRLYPKMKADYYQGWHKSRIVDPPPTGAFAPDRPAAAAGEGAPAFSYRHPVTGRAITAPGGAAFLPIGAPLRTGAAPAASGSLATRLAEAERRLAQAKAYDAVENISSAFGNYIDDYSWDQSTAMMAKDGRRQKYQVGFYIGPARIREAEMRNPGTLRRPRVALRIHARIQPVIHVSDDARTAKFRTRLFHRATGTGPGAWQSGMYPNDLAVLEDGVWKLQHVAIDEPYYQGSYANGWARARERAPAPPPAAGAQPSGQARMRTEFPPDVPVTAPAMARRQRAFVQGREDWLEFPDIKPMWFHYRNPVSGRTPPNYCPDQMTC